MDITTLFIHSQPLIFIGGISLLSNLSTFFIRRQFTGLSHFAPCLLRKFIQQTDTNIEFPQKEYFYAENYSIPIQIYSRT